MFGRAFSLLLISAITYSTLTYANQDCPIADDQLATFHVRAYIPFPLPVRLEIPKIWSKADVAEITKSAKTWNVAGQAIIGKPLFNVVSGTDIPKWVLEFSYKTFAPLARGEKPASVAVIVPVANLKHAAETSSWNTSKNKGSRTQHIIEIRDFDSLEALALHELGHVLALNHSCIDCENAPSEYLTAVMAPMHDPSRLKLQPNDLARLKCVLKKYRVNGK